MRVFWVSGREVVVVVVREFLGLSFWWGNESGGGISFWIVGEREEFF